MSYENFAISAMLRRTGRTRAPAGENEIMVNILAGQFRSRAVQSHRLQFEHHESPRRILCECLIDANPDLLPRRHRTGEEMRLDEFLRDIQSHVDLRVLGLASGKPCIK